MSVQIIEIIQTLQRAGKSSQEITEQLLRDGYTQPVIEAGFTLAAEEAVAIKKAAPTLSELLTVGWAGAKKQPRMILLIATPMLLVAVLRALIPLVADTQGLAIALWAMIGFSILSYVIILGAALFVFTAEVETVISIQSALRWSLRQTPQLFLLYLLMSLLLWGGLLLFMVPALIIFVSAYFAQIVFVKEGLKGMNAILFSRQLVAGRWWLVASRVLGFLALLLVPTIIVSLIESIVVTAWDSTYTALAADFINELIVALITTMALAAFYHFYKYLRTSAPEVAGPSTLTKVGYWFIVGLGVVMAVLITVVLTKYDSIEHMETQFRTNREIESELMAVKLHATDFVLATEDVSFEGVCDKLVAAMSSRDGVVCNDSTDEWALQVEREGALWCVGEGSVPKRVQTALEDRTSCLSLP